MTDVNWSDGVEEVGITMPVPLKLDKGGWDTTSKGKGHTTVVEGVTCIIA